jgi:hypothetical protein
MKSRFPPSLSDMSLSYLSIFNIMSPAIAAELILLMILYVEKTPRNVPVREKNPPKFATAYVVINATAGGTVNLYVSQVGLK